MQRHALARMVQGMANWRCIRAGFRTGGWVGEWLWGRGRRWCRQSPTIGGVTVSLGKPISPLGFPEDSLVGVSLGKSSGFPYDFPVICSKVSLGFPLHV